MADNKSPFPPGFTPFDALSGMDKRTPVLVAFSGGADSRALFELTARYCRENGSHFYACHVNHGIRGAEAIRDRDFCATVARKCPECKDFFVLDADVPSMAKASGRSLELEARLLRYGFFNNIMKENSIPILVTAHNADDNLETLIFNLSRGSGAKGMRGIPRIRETEVGLILRPILDMTKSEILAFCDENRLDFVTDSTNECTDYSRNLIRAMVIPLLEELNPEVRRAASRLSDSMRELCSFAEESANNYDLSAASVASAPSALLPFIIGKELKRLGCDAMPEAIHLSALRELCRKSRDGSSVSLPGNMRGILRSGVLRFEPDTGRSDGEIIPQNHFELELKEGENTLPSGYRIVIGDSGECQDCYIAANPDSISPPLTARCRREGDRILSGGMHKSVKKLMCDKKIPRDERNSLPVICDAKGILWIPRVAARDGITSKNQSLKITIFK